MASIVTTPDALMLLFIEDEIYAARGHNIYSYDEESGVVGHFVGRLSANRRKIDRNAKEDPLPPLTPHVS